MGELLLELLSEEIPARMQRRAIADLVALVRDRLAAAEIPAQSLRGYVTPRRLAVIADGIPLRQPERREERRGPRADAPAQAVENFWRVALADPAAKQEFRVTARGIFCFAVIERPGRAAAEVLPELLHAAIAELPWPKSMRFPAASLRWPRPLSSVICLFDGKVLPLALDKLPVGRTTHGHRFLSDGEITVENAADYLDKLEAAYVVLDHDRRREMIRAELDRLATTETLRVKPDPALLDEVTGLVEFPVVLMGRIEDEFVRPVPEGLPPEVLATAMRTHQKYFSCLYPGGAPAPRFLFIANNLTSDDGRTIVAGNERVLRARLADARFFWDQDRKVPLASRVEALKQRVYYDKLPNPSVYEKAQRMAVWTGELVAYVKGADAGRARRAALLAKADLSTGMVGEFPELQGVMGRYYSLYPADQKYREDPRVADAIAEHYKPLGPYDSCPVAPDSIVVALADKIDALVAFFGIGEKPSGSRDPFALRRAALGLIRIILEQNLRMQLSDALLPKLIAGQEPIGRGPFFLVPGLLEFIADRLKVHLREQGVRHDLIAAVFALAEDDLVRLLARVDALTRFLATEDGTNLLIAYRRAANIVAIEERRDRCVYDGDPDPSLLRQPEEKLLAGTLAATGGSVCDLIEGEHFAGAMAALATLRRPVDAFFDRVTVNTDDRALRENRLRLLSRIRNVMNQVADFSQIEG